MRTASAIFSCYSWVFLYANKSCYRNTKIENKAYDYRYIFEMLTLEGAQSGLSWNIVYPLNPS
ncbi:DNA-3-methyladenine glycosylase I [Oceanobacillus massiliensis]|uniref:DNA-3-methyladenine glycosylase I n=1 Tax=Oceanobacillus massiliensis TaxID=1465765 RepID=UPI003019998A